MENLKVIAQIAKQDKSYVDRVVGQVKAASVVSRIAPRVTQLRRKSLKVEESAHTRLSRLQFQDSFETLRTSSFFDYGEKMEWSTQGDTWEILTPWIDGQTLIDLQEHERHRVSPLEPGRIKAKLKVWVRFFERLSLWHAQGILHGNLKPGNLLVCENLTADVLNNLTSEFFQKNEAIPHVVFLDGGYQHILNSSQQNIEQAERGQNSTAKFNETFWLPPEIAGPIEGAYSEASDLFGLAAIMAWDFGMMSDIRIAQNENSILHNEKNGAPLFGSQTRAVQYLWPLLCADNKSDSTFLFGNKWYKWNKKNPVVEFIRKLRLLLGRSISPFPEKRHTKVREIAFELMMMSNRLNDVKDDSNFDAQVTEISFPPENMSQSSCSALFRKQLLKLLEVPETLVEMVEASKSQNSQRFWYVARNLNSNAHMALRRVAAGLHSVSKNVQYFRVRHSDRNFPFATINRLLAGLVSEACRRDLTSVTGMHGLFSSLSFQSHFIVHVLPQLRPFFDCTNISSNKLAELDLHARHETIHQILDKLFVKLIELSGIEILVIDDIQRSDSSSLSAILRAMNSNLNVKWILSTREGEECSNKEHQESMDKMKEGDHSSDVLSNQRNMAWAIKLNAIKPEFARIIASWTSISSSLKVDSIEHLSLKLDRVPELLGNSYHTGKTSLNDKVIPDSIGVLESNEKTRSRNYVIPKDLALSVSEAYKHARSLGILIENRDLVTGRLIDLNWASERVALSLSKLLNKEMRANVSFIIAEDLASEMENKSVLWTEVMRLSDLYSDCDLNSCGHAAFASLVQASELVSDLHSTLFLICRFQRLEERLERGRAQDGDSLIPRIREHIGDLSRTLGKFEIATKYYDSVEWNLASPKRRAILALKSFMPSRILSREDRNDKFNAVVKNAEISGLLPQSEELSKVDPNLLAAFELKRLRTVLADEHSIGSGRSDIQSIAPLVSVSLSSGDAKAERLPYQPRSKAIRESTFAQFLRNSVGWIDHEIIFPHVIRNLHLAIDSEDGSTIAHALFTMLLCGERHIKKEVRSLAIEFVTDVASRTQNEMALAEALLYKAWSNLFYEGNLVDARKALEGLHTSANDLPQSLRLCSNKLLFILDMEMHGLEELGDMQKRKARITARLKDYGLAKWEVAMCIYGDLQKRVVLKESAEESLISGVISEKIDQLLLYTWYCIEGGQVQAASTLVSDARDVRAREWFADRTRQLEFMPETIARKWTERTADNLQLDRDEQFKNLRLDELNTSSFGNSGDTVNIILFTSDKQNRFDLLRMLGLKTNQTTSTVSKTVKSKQPFDEDLRSELRAQQLALVRGQNWSGDIAIESNLRFDKAASPDPEKLTLLAETAAQAGFFWTAHRFARKAGIDLLRVVAELENQGVAIPKTTRGGNSSRDSSASEIDKSSGFQLGGAASGAVALNYVLEFVHNLQRQSTESSTGWSIEASVLARCILKSIPTETDATEATIAEALKAVVRRMGHLSATESFDKAG